MRKLRRKGFLILGERAIIKRARMIFYLFFGFLKLREERRVVGQVGSKWQEKWRGIQQSAFRRGGYSSNKALSLCPIWPFAIPF